MSKKEQMQTENESVNAESVADESVEMNAECNDSDKSSREADKKFKELESRIAELEGNVTDKDAKIAELNDRYARMMAEYDNYRKRSAKEKGEMYDKAYAEALNVLLPTIDNLERAVGVSDAEAVLKGLDMTLKGAVDDLGKIGVEAFGAENDKFDEHMHYAVTSIEDPNHGENEIVAVIKKGYRKGTDIIRVAEVVVAR